MTSVKSSLTSLTIIFSFDFQISKISKVGEAAKIQPNFYIYLTSTFLLMNFPWCIYKSNQINNDSPMHQAEPLANFKKRMKTVWIVYFSRFCLLNVFTLLLAELDKRIHPILGWKVVLNLGFLPTLYSKKKKN